MRNIGRFEIFLKINTPVFLHNNLDMLQKSSEKGVRPEDTLELLIADGTSVSRESGGRGGRKMSEGKSAER